MRHLAIALALGCVSCSSCARERSAASDAGGGTIPMTVDASAAGVSDAGAIDAADDDATAESPPSANAPWELVAKRKASDHALWIADIGPRVLVGDDRSPLAWADGPRPLEPSPRIARTRGDVSVVGVAGTYPDAVFVATENRSAFVATDRRVHQMVADGFRDVGPIPPRTQELVTWGERGAFAVASVIEHNSRPTITRDDMPATRLHPFLAQGEPPPVFDLEPAFGSFSAAGTRDGHLWLLGFRAGRKGMWLAHVQPGKKTGYQLYPGSEKCDEEGFGIYVYRSRIVATSGERAFLYVSNDAAECMGPLGGYLYERSEGGFAGIPLPTKAENSLSTGILGTARDGTLYFHTPDYAVFRRNVDGTMTRVAIPKGCSPTRIIVRDDGDTWMTARCADHDGVYRRGRPQPPLSL